MQWDGSHHTWAMGSEEEKRMILHPHLVEEDQATSPDFRTMREVTKMGSSLDTMVQLTGDCPSSNISGMMPLMDLQVWVQDNLLLMEISARPASMKRTDCLDTGSSED